MKRMILSWPSVATMVQAERWSSRLRASNDTVRRGLEAPQSGAAGLGGGTKKLCLQVHVKTQQAYQMHLFIACEPVAHANVLGVRANVFACPAACLHFCMLAHSFGGEPVAPRLVFPRCLRARCFFAVCLCVCAIEHMCKFCME